MKSFSPFTAFDANYKYFQDSYTFEICPENRINDLVTFIDTYWKKDHIFVRSPEFFKWQHYDKENKRYNFFIAVYKPTNEIHAMIGFTLSSHFDSNITTPVIWGNCWKSRTDIAEPGLGLMLDWRVNKEFNQDIIAFGLSEIAVGLSRHSIGGIADQYYIINPIKSNFMIADNVDINRTYSSNVAFSDKSLVGCSMNDFEKLEASVVQAIPKYKSIKYYINRFFKHPIYDYYASSIYNSNLEVEGVIFWRLCYHESAKCIRIVDYFGMEDALSGCYDSFAKLLIEHDAEYIDFICVNMPSDMMDKAGFLCRDKKSNIVLPNYFEPFLRSNIDVSFAYYKGSELHDKRIFKGDADQDRPS